MNTTTKPSIRYRYIIAVLITAAMLLYTFKQLYNLPPCPLCDIGQLLFYILVGIYLVASVFNPRRKPVILCYSLLNFLFSSIGIVIAARILWLHSKTTAQACTLGLWYILQAMPIKQVLPMVWNGGGSCTTPQNMLLHMSLGQWLMACFIVSALMAVWLLTKARCK